LSAAEGLRGSSPLAAVILHAGPLSGQSLFDYAVGHAVVDDDQAAGDREVLAEARLIREEAVESVG
jgi:hypothetical protein